MPSPLIYWAEHLHGFDRGDKFEMGIGLAYQAEMTLAAHFEQVIDLGVDPAAAFFAS